MPEFFLTGLENLGNTCYMNSVIQGLFATKEFREYITETKSNKKLHSSLSQLFKDMIKVGQKSDSNCLSPLQFRDVFGKIRPDFNDKDQHDSQEFLRLLIDGLHQEVNEAKGRKPAKYEQPKSAKDAWISYRQYMDDSFLVSLFVGQMRSTIRCTECDHRSHCWDSFWEISLSIPEKETELNVKELYQDYFKDEELVGDSMPTCAKCKTKRKSIKSSQIKRCPLILTLSLKRFGNDGKKVSKSVYVNKSLIINTIPYFLYACVCHKDGVGFNGWYGHYSIYCRYTSSNWYHFDDNNVDVVEDWDPENDAYILFYHMKDTTISY